MANIEKMHDEKKVLSFEHPIQRKSEQWNNQQKSSLPGIGNVDNCSILPDDQWRFGTHSHPSTWSSSDVQHLLYYGRRILCPINQIT